MKVLIPASATNRRMDVSLRNSRVESGWNMEKIWLMSLYVNPEIESRM